MCRVMQCHCCVQAWSNSLSRGVSVSLGSANGSVADLTSAAALAGQASSDGGRGNTTPVQVRAGAGLHCAQKKISNLYLNKTWFSEADY